MTYHKFGTRKWRDYFANYVTPRGWKKGARDVPFGMGAKALYVDGTDGNDTNDGESWKTAKKTIQEAIDTASSWTTLFIKEDTYTESVTVPATKSSIQLIGESWKGVIVNGGNSPALTINSDGNFSHNLYLKSTAGAYTCAIAGARNVITNCFFECNGTVELTLSGDENIVEKCETAGASTRTAITLSGARNEILFCRVKGAEKVIGLNVGTDDLKIHDCTLMDATIHAISVSASTNNNLIYNNNFINNTAAIANSGTGTKVTQNFYDNHTNVDNGFGIAKAPYAYTGGMDPRPVVNRNGWLSLSWADADLVALASVCTETRLAELDAANLPADLDSILADLDSILAKFLTADIFRENAATGTANNPARINDNVLQVHGDQSSFDAINEYAEIDLGVHRFVSLFRMYGSEDMSGNGRWKIQHWGGSSWIDNTTDIAILTSTAWGAWTALTTTILTTKIRLVATTLDTAGGENELGELQMKG